MQVKWLRRLKLTTGPMMTKDETSKYTITLPDGKTQQFVFPIEAKSVITRPSPGSQAGRRRRVRNIRPRMVGLRQDRQSRRLRRWRQKLGAGGLQEPVLSMALTRFRLPWRWDGGPAVLQSRAVDEFGYVQPSREASAGGTRGQDDLPLQWHHELGCLTGRRVEPCLRVMVAGVAGVAVGCWRCATADPGRSRDSQSRPPASRRGPRRMGHQHCAGRHRPAARQRNAGAGRGRSIVASCQTLPWRARRRKAERRAGWRQGNANRRCQCR